MKSLLCKSFTILFLLGTASVLSCYAQITTKVSFTTSSAFVVEKTTLPPGTYMIRPFEDEPDVYELTSSTGHSVIFACEATGQSATKTELSFHRYGHCSISNRSLLPGALVLFQPVPPKRRLRNLERQRRRPLPAPSTDRVSVEIGAWARVRVRRHLAHRRG